MDRYNWKYGKPMLCSDLCSCCTGLKNAREVAWHGDWVPKLVCAAEQAWTRSHLIHSDCVAANIKGLHKLPLLFTSLWPNNKLFNNAPKYTLNVVLLILVKLERSNLAYGRHYISQRVGIAALKWFF